jgi:dihydroorotate dehydrogenase
LERPVATIVGVNIGKGHQTPLERAVDDYVALARRLSPLADYLAVNVSSPNTPGLRRLQAGPVLTELLTAVAAERGSAPVVAKLSPDVDDAELDAALDAISAAGIDGVIATNTTTARLALRSRRGDEAGGLSGAALTEPATRMVREIYRRTGGSLPIIAAGGVMTGDDAAAKLDAGASLVQVYTGLVYRGPRLLGELVAATG